MSGKRPEVRTPDILGGKGEDAIEIDLTTLEEGEDYLTIDLTEGIYVNSAGNLQVTLKNMDETESITFESLQEGMIYPFRVKQVWGDNTTAGIIGVY